MWVPAALLFLLFQQNTDYNAAGRKALEAQKYEDAAQLFTKAVEADPKNYGAHFNLALSYTFLNRDPEAITEYKKVLELSPGLYPAELNLGMVLLRQKQAVEAVPHLQSAADKKPKEYRPRFYLAEALLETGQFANAEAQYKIALQINPKSAGAELGLGRAEARQNRLAEAAPHFRKAAELDPEYKDALLELASLYEKNKQPADAIAIYQQFPDNKAAQERLGQLLIDTKDYKDAITRLERVVAEDPTNANVVALATAYVLDKQLDKALPLFEESVASDPNNYGLRMVYGRALRDSKKYQPAAQQFFTAVKLKPDSREAWNELAGMLIMLEDYPQALAALDHVQKLGEETSGIYFFRAIVLDKLHQLKPALDSYQKFLAMSQGKNPNQEFQARQRVRIIERELNKR